MLDTEWDATAGKVLDDKLAERVNSLSAFKAEADVRANALPQAPDKYEVKLPEGFKPPAGVQFEFDHNDPLLAEARKLAFERKMDQQGFSDFLGLYAANKIQEFQQVSGARDAELGKLGAAANQRVDAVTTWLNSKFGGKAGVLVDTIKKFPVAANVEVFEDMIKMFSGQGAAPFGQQHREQQAEAGKIAGFETMTFEQRRAAQMNLKAASGGR